jgi:hypothetical protein
LPSILFLVVDARRRAFRQHPRTYRAGRCPHYGRHPRRWGTTAGRRWIFCRTPDRHADAYEAALAALREDTQTWRADVLARDPDELGEDEQPATADVEGLRRFLEDEVLQWFENRRKELANRPLIREQAFGEALDPDKLERLGRYEVHLDRKLERMLAMLLRLKELRRDETSP